MINRPSSIYSWKKKPQHFVEYLPLLCSKHWVIVQSHEVKQTHKVSCASSRGRGEWYVGIPHQEKLGKRKIESVRSFLMLHCSVKPGRSEGQPVWKKWMTTNIHYLWRLKEQQKKEEDFQHEGILNSYAVHEVSVAWSCVPHLLRFSQFPRTK